MAFFKKDNNCIFIIANFYLFIIPNKLNKDKDKWKINIFPNLLKFPGKIVEIFCFIIKLESNTNFFPGWFLIKNRGVTFKARKLLSYSLWTQHHSRIVILEKISTFFSPSCSYSLQRVACFNLGFPLFQINFVFTFLFCFLCFFFVFCFC